MKIAIVGAGGVGGFLAAMLVRAGEEVFLVARGKHLAAIREKGICVELNGERICSKPRSLSDDPADFATTMDAVLFCTKGYDLENAAESVRPVVNAKTLLVPLGNGVGNAETLKRLFPDNPVANGAIYIVSHIRSPGVVAVKGKGAYVVIGVDGKIPEAVERLGRTLKRAGIRTKVSDTVTTDVWKKYLLIAALATLTSCYGKPMGAIVEEHRDELDAILHEILAVGRAEGAILDESNIARVIEQVAKVPYDSPTSMWLDFEAGGETELEQLSGYIVEKANVHGIDVPLMKKCYEALKKEGSPSSV
ncbi:ketopantoate reductase family protein [Hydrogenimonas cancrithermarum]|uniref:2-dehydropantoate 2-reductase n=1 Tax=Hydrogenimonas cancrithermarum TaxID=2993563 RepID=A0ABN6WW41_9BACT|nr:2-dehydropantoate 2-reductase [Hydrogenimonas cancrithermarum]BDY12512.1 putative oxidoreductase YkpB [Hydrogenimonas cancrithermarum]